MKTSMVKQALALIACAGMLASANLSGNPSESLAAQTSKDFTAVAKSSIPSVVAIQVKQQPKASSSVFNWDSSNDDLYQFFFGIPNPNGQSQSQPIMGQASGFVISPEGHILTNSHVVQDMSEIKVIFNDGREFPAKVVGQDPNTDVAVIKIDDSEEKLPSLPLGNSDNLEIGQWAIAIGNPFGLQATLTVGVISAKSRNNLDLANIEDFIQTDAAINRGNSGGPLLNLDGEVIGMNTAIVSNMSSGGYVGIGFAIPSNILKHVSNQIIKTGKVTRGFIGVALQNIDQNLAHSFGLKQTEGALVADVTKGSPADKAGIRQGDIIDKYNKQPVMNISALRNSIALNTPGTQIVLTILRSGKTLEIPLEIGAFPDSSSTQPAMMTGNKLGFDVQELTPETARTLGIKDEKGVVISKVDANSPAAMAGLKKGTLITSINQQKVENVDQFYEALKASPPNKPVLLLVKQGDHTRFISIKAN
jgi:serine protease Do